MNTSYRRIGIEERSVRKKERFFFWVMAISMAVFVGLRLSGNDTATYRHSYELFPSGFSNLLSINWLHIANAPGYRALGIITKTLGFSVQDYLMTYAVFTILTYLWFIRKYSNSSLFPVFLFIAMGVYTFSMAAIKQTAAVALLVIATDRAINRKYVSFVFFVVLAMLFHAYSFMFFIIPFLDFKPWTQKTLLYLFGTVAIVMSFDMFLSYVLNVTDLIGGDYSEESFTKEGVNIFRVLVVWVPVLLSFLVKEAIQKQNDRRKNIFINASIINALIMFIGMFGTANYFARLANYFSIFQVLALPMILDFFDHKSRSFLQVSATLCYSAYFYYSTMLAHGSFDARYSFMPFKDYIRQLLS